MGKLALNVFKVFIMVLVLLLAFSLYMYTKDMKETEPNEPIDLYSDEIIKPYFWLIGAMVFSLLLIIVILFIKKYS